MDNNNGSNSDETRAPERPPRLDGLVKWALDDTLLRDTAKWALHLEAQLAAHEEAWRRLVEDADVMDAAMHAYYGTDENDPAPEGARTVVEMDAAIRAARSAARGEPVSRLPPCAVIGCDSLADPRWYVYDEEKRPYPACDGHGGERHPVDRLQAPAPPPSAEPDLDLIARDVQALCKSVSLVARVLDLVAKVRELSAALQAVTDESEAWKECAENECRAKNDARVALQVATKERDELKSLLPEGWVDRQFLRADFRTAWVEEVAAEERQLLRERDEARAALAGVREQLQAWATPSPGGMGMGLHSEMWPPLTPSARKRMLELAALGPVAAETPKGES